MKSLLRSFTIFDEWTGLFDERSRIMTIMHCWQPNLLETQFFAQTYCLFGPYNFMFFNLTMREDYVELQHMFIDAWRKFKWNLNWTSTKIVDASRSLHGVQYINEKHPRIDFFSHKIVILYFLILVLFTNRNTIRFLLYLRVNYISYKSYLSCVVDISVPLK